MDENVTPPWANELTEGEFISKYVTYSVGDYFDRYDKDVFENEEVGDMTYYFFDPTKHGYPKDRKYPLLTFFHGATNSFEGDVCINYCVGELYGSPTYQESMGGAYILIPLANEKRLENGDVECWGHKYINPIFSLVDDFVAKRADTIGARFAFGNSSGASFCIKMATANPNFFTAIIPVGFDYSFTDQMLEDFDKSGLRMFLANSRHDEFYDFDETFGPNMKKLEKLKNAFLYFPKWTYNGDGGIATINVGVEMGQHCLMNSMQANLMFDDGTPMDSRLPQGMTGWIRGICEEEEK